MPAPKPFRHRISITTAGFHFLDQEMFETHTLEAAVMENAAGFLDRRPYLELLKYNGRPSRHGWKRDWRSGGLFSSSKARW